MYTITDLPCNDPCVKRVLRSMWIGDVKIQSTTVLNPVFVQNKIKMLETADVSNSWESMILTQTISDLKKILSYIQ